MHPQLSLGADQVSIAVNKAYTSGWAFYLWYNPLSPILSLPPNSTSYSFCCYFTNLYGYCACLTLILIWTSWWFRSSCIKRKWRSCFFTPHIWGITILHSDQSVECQDLDRSSMVQYECYSYYRCCNWLWC
jgi:hypothetical protein